MIDAVHDNFSSSNPTAGNEPQVRTWLGDVQSIPAYQVRSALQPLPYAPSSLPFVSAFVPHTCVTVSCDATWLIMLLTATKTFKGKAWLIIKLHH